MIQLFLCGQLHLFVLIMISFLQVISAIEKCGPEVNSKYRLTFNVTGARLEGFVLLIILRAEQDVES